MRRNILISSAGRRVGLLGCFREALNGAGRIAVIDSSPTAPTAQLADCSWRVPPCKSPEFIPRVISLCQQENLSVIIPTIDPELAVYAEAGGRFQELGILACVSSPEAVRIGSDKAVTNAWLVQNGFPTVRQGSPAEVLRHKSGRNLPLIAKPRNGSASVGLRHISTWHELEQVALEGADYVVEEKAVGREFTINVFVNRQGRCVCAIPHWRMEVRAGEVSKAITVKDRRLISLGRRIAEALPGAYGSLNIQCFMTDCGDIRVIEINPRFGGGYPLAHTAGGRFASWILDELDGRELSYFEDWQDGLVMLRYDNAVYVSGSALAS